MTHFLHSTWHILRNRTIGKDAAEGQHSEKERDYELIPGRRPGKHIINYPDDRNTRIEVFFKDFTNGKGPRELADGQGAVISLIVRGFEVIRFDCLGTTGHYHIVFARPDDDPVTDTPNRLWFYESTVDEQIKRAVFEIRTNIHYYIQRNPKKQVRNMYLDPDALDAMCREALQTALTLTVKL